MVMAHRVHLPMFERPKTVGDCRHAVRPCPWVSCRFNLLIDVLEDGSIVINAKYRRPDGAQRVIAPKPETEDRFQDEIEDAIEVWFDEPIPPVRSCVLDETMHLYNDDKQLDEIAELMFVSRERIRQIEAAALVKVKRRCLELGITFADLMAELARTRGE